MPNATVSLGSTTTIGAMSMLDASVTLASTSGVTPGVCLYIERELMKVLSLGLGTSVNVLRGQGGTATTAHASMASVWIGRPDQFYNTDPRGLPPNEVLIYPYINVITGGLWAAQGDETGPQLAARTWQQITTAQAIGALGVRQNTTTVPV